MKTLNEMQQRIENAKEMAEHYCKRYNHFKVIESALDYSIGLLESESDKVELEDEKNYEPYKYDYVKALYEHKKEIANDKERYCRWMKESHTEIKMLEMYASSEQEINS
jgi:molybdopterin-biosynthesis enzyme MoeA-like protein